MICLIIIHLIIPVDDSVTTTTTMAPFNCPTADGFFPIPGICSSEYYICTGGSVSIGVKAQGYDMKYLLLP